MEWRKIIDGPIAITRPLFAQIADRDIKSFEAKWKMSDAIKAFRIIKALSQEIPALQKQHVPLQIRWDSQPEEEYRLEDTRWFSAYHDSVRASALGGQGLASSQDILQVAQSRKVKCLVFTPALLVSKPSPTFVLRCPCCYCVRFWPPPLCLFTACSRPPARSFSLQPNSIAPALLAAAYQDFDVLLLAANDAATAFPTKVGLPFFNNLFPSNC